LSSPRPACGAGLLSEITRLSSGLTLVTEMRPEVETVALGVFVNAGTRDEHPQEHGLAHFLEHMAFKGTKRRSAYETVAEIEALGGDINAETSPETTSYTVRMLAEDWNDWIGRLARHRLRAELPRA
jgi:predicted Zn-dependent peptidase